MFGSNSMGRVSVNSDGEARKTGEKLHFAGLDGLRGVAALAVMFMHLVGLFEIDVDPPIPAFLAVDLFFMLSGFVLAYAYGAKLDAGMGWKRFMEVRLIRLYPLLLVAILLGVAVSLLKQQMEGVWIPEERPIMIVPALLLLPTGLLFADHHFPFGTPYAFAFNFPVWSLFFELVASAIYGTGARNLPRPLLTLLFLTSLVGMAALAIWDGSIEGLGVQGLIYFMGGFLRILVPFSLGIFLFRSGFYRRFRAIPYWLIAVGLAAMLLVPRHRSALVEIAIILIVFPVTIGFGARVELSRATARICDILGRLSYPLYLLHIPVSRATGFVARRFIDSPYALVAVTAMITIAVSWAALVLYDEPVRRWLTGIMKQRRAPLVTSPAA